MLTALLILRCRRGVTKAPKVGNHCHSKKPYDRFGVNWPATRIDRYWPEGAAKTEPMLALTRQKQIL